jgi:hypothetical protein
MDSVEPIELTVTISGRVNVCRGYDDKYGPQTSWTEVVEKKRKKKTDVLEGRLKVTFSIGLLDKHQREKLTLFIKRS